MTSQKSNLGFGSGLFSKELTMVRTALVTLACLVALGGSLQSIQAGMVVIEDFESGNLSQYTTNVGGTTFTNVSSTYAHDGIFGLGITGPATGGVGWIYRNDAGAQVSQGDTISVWIQFAGIVDARAYFGFGSSAAGTLSFVLAPNTGEIIFQENLAYGFANLNTSSQTFTANQWYRAEVIWEVGGNLTGNLYASDGTTLLNSVSSSSNLFTSGGIAFRGFGGVKAFDTVTVSREISAVPEPSSLAIFAIAIGVLACCGVRRRNDRHQPFQA